MDWDERRDLPLCLASGEMLHELIAIWIALDVTYFVTGTGNAAVIKSGAIRPIQTC